MENLPIGENYTIEEILPIESDYELIDSENANGTLEGGINIASFVNRLKPPKQEEPFYGSFMLQASKNMVGHTISGGEFTFAVFDTIYDNSIIEASIIATDDNDDKILECGIVYQKIDAQGNILYKSDIGETETFQNKIAGGVL